MSEDKANERVEVIKNFVILTNTRINYILQLFDLFREKNRILMVSEGFFAMVLRDMNRSILLDIRALVENRDDSHNLKTLTNELTPWVTSNRDAGVLAEFSKLTKELTSYADDPLAKSALIIAGSQAAHRSLKMPSKKETFTYQQAKDWLELVGDKLNKITGLLWSSSTVLEMHASTDESFKRELTHTELAELAGTHLLRIDESHAAVVYAKDLLDRKNKAAD